MSNYQVQVIFNDGTNEYTFPLVYHISDPKEGIKATVIEGNRGDGSIIIPGGRKSQEITIYGVLFSENGYAGLTNLMNEMKSKVTTNVATLTLRHYDSTWVTDWTYQVRRISEIEFPESLRTEAQNYRVSFIVIGY